MNISKYTNNEKGASLLEYLLLGLCIMVVALAGVANLGLFLQGSLESTGTEISNAMEQAEGN
jgi:Flp pilus assembly pilin Flp